MGNEFVAADEKCDVIEMEARSARRNDCTGLLRCRVGPRALPEPFWLGHDSVHDI
jgi:hypothetical protein